MKENNIHEVSWTKSLLKYGKWYLISSFLTKGLSFFLVPVYVNNISQEDYGILQSFHSIAVFLPIILSCSLDSAYARYYHEFKNNKNKLSLYFSTIYWFILFYGVGILSLFFFTSKFWVKDLLTIPLFPYAYIAFIPALLAQLSQLSRIHLEQSLETKRMILLDFSSAIISGGVSVTLLLVMKYGFVSQLVGIMVGAIYLWIYYLWFSKREGLLHLAFDIIILKTCLKFSIPLMPAMLGSWISSASDRLIIATYVDMKTVGLYSFSFQIATLIYIIGDAITRVLGPLTMSGLVCDKEGTKNKIIVFSLNTWGIMLLANLVLFLFSKEIVALMGTNAYEDAFTIIPFLGFVYVIGMQQRYPTQIISFYKKTWIISVGCILMGVVNLALNFILVPKFGYKAAVLNLVISNIFYVVWSFVWANKYEFINYNWKKSSQLFLLFIISFIFINNYLMFEVITVTNILVKGLLSILLGLLFVLIINKKYFKLLALYLIKNK